MSLTVETVRGDGTSLARRAVGASAGTLHRFEGLTHQSGHEPVSYLADAIERGFRVLDGMGVMLAVAALLEGFVSPYYYRFLLVSG